MDNHQTTRDRHSRLRHSHLTLALCPSKKNTSRAAVARSNLRRRIARRADADLFLWRSSYLGNNPSSQQGRDSTRSLNFLDQWFSKLFSATPDLNVRKFSGPFTNIIKLRRTGFQNHSILYSHTDRDLNITRDPSDHATPKLRCDTRNCRATPFGVATPRIPGHEHAVRTISLLFVTG